MVMPEKMVKKKKDHETTGNNYRYRSDVDFTALINDALGLIDEQEKKCSSTANNRSTAPRCGNNTNAKRHRCHCR